MGEPTTLFDAGPEARVREYARRLGLDDEQAIAAALHRYRVGAGRGSRHAVGEACALLRSWWRHPSHQPAA